ncbi:ATP-binding protein [Simiduia aestuariiviva]|uniref:histidine kinase n=1 Tax=Simiduia aestuariiviva TaxID=1510459 RepID=A0A839UM45_9GAMM|nr:ATP-binding protein [Simiduia aestuariiviva]MBB3167630.1 signal transduction histidine kinase/CheY-like chemotaxis protein [Simiduia aestuariiviva]
MPVHRHHVPSYWPRFIAITSCLALLGWLGNYTSLPLLFGIDFIFGSIASFVALALLGPRSAIIVALIASSYTWLLWNHPYAIAIFGAEVAFVALWHHLRPQHNLVYADVCYWLLLGIPLVLFFYQYFLNVGFEQSVFIGTKQAMNGVFNLLCANLLVLAARSVDFKGLQASRFCQLSIRNLTFNLVLGVVLLVGTTPIIIYQYQLSTLLEQDLEEEMAVTAKLLAAHAYLNESPSELQQWLAELPLDEALFIELQKNGTRIQRGAVPQINEYDATSNSKLTHLTLFVDGKQKSIIQQWNQGIYVYQQTSGDWNILLGRPANKVVQKLQARKQGAFLLLNGLVLLAILLAQVLSKIIETPLQQLRRRTHSIGAQSPDEKTADTASNIIEFRLLFEAFRDMAERLDNSLSELKNTNDTLEQRVENRTKDIQRLSLVASTTTNGVVILNNKHEIVWTNQAFHKMLAKNNNRVWSKPFIPFLRMRDNAQKTAFEQAIVNEDRFSMQLDILNDEHNKLWVDLEWINTTQEKHGHEGVIVILSDITAEKRINDELTHYAARLESINIAQEKAKQLAEGAALAKSQFMASMSHEIRTPLNGVVGMLGLLTRSEQSEQQNHYTQLALHSAESLLNIINEILDFSKIEAGQLHIERLDFDIIKLISDFAATAAVRAQEKGIELYLDATALEHTKINSDSSRILQILNNLMGNAIKFTEQGHVQLDVHISEDNQGQHQLECTVSDTGIGIEAHVLPHLFEAFTQADASTTRKYGGTGLGLAITKQLCEILEGQLEVDSVPGQGSRFSFRIPIDIASDDQPASRLWPDLANQNILVVDDLEHRRALTLRYLSHTGAHIIGCASLDANTDVDVQWLLAGPESINAIEALRASGKLSQCHILLLCSHSKREELVAIGRWVNFHHLPIPLTPLAMEHLLPNATPRIETTNKQPRTRCIGKLLLVEDNHVNQELARSLLEDMGYHVRMAANGAEAMDHLIDTPRQDAFDLVLMDCQMPEMDGYTATRHIRNGKAGHFNKDIPIIAMTANAMHGDRERCMEAGMSDYLTKPLDFDLVEKVLGNWLANESPKPIATEVATPDSQPTSAPTEELVWDKADALKRVRQREDRLRSLIELFLRDMPARCEKIEQSVQDNNLEDIQRVAHEIKGVAGNISAKCLYKTARELELACKEKRATQPLFERLKQEMQRTTQAFNNYLEQPAQQV